MEAVPQIASATVTGCRTALSRRKVLPEVPSLRSHSAAVHRIRMRASSGQCLRTDAPKGLVRELKLERAPSVDLDSPHIARRTSKAQVGAGRRRSRRHAASSPKRSRDFVGAGSESGRQADDRDALVAARQDSRIGIQNPNFAYVGRFAFGVGPTGRRWPTNRSSVRFLVVDRDVSVST